MTYRELRQVLTEVEDQELTVKELRAKLYELEDQDAEVTERGLYTLTKKQRAYRGFTITGSARDGYEAKNEVVTMYGSTLAQLKKRIDRFEYYN